MSGTSTPRRAWNQHEDDLVYKFVAEAIWMLNQGYGEEKIPGILPGAVVAGQVLQNSSIPRARSSFSKDVSSCCDPEDCGTETDGAEPLSPETLPDKSPSETPSRVKTFVDSLGVTRQVKLPNCNTLLDTIDWQALSDKILRHRTPKSIRERWRNHLDPSINHGPWSQQEDEILFRAVQEHGTSWTYISSLLQGRPELQCKNRYYATVRKQRRRQKRVRNSEPMYESWQPEVASNAPKLAPLSEMRAYESRGSGIVTSSSPWYNSGFPSPAPMPQQQMGAYGYYSNGSAPVLRGTVPVHSQTPYMMPLTPRQSGQWYIQQQQSVAPQNWQPPTSQWQPVQTCYPGSYPSYGNGMQGQGSNMPQYQTVPTNPVSYPEKRIAQSYAPMGEVARMNEVSGGSKMRRMSPGPAPTPTPPSAGTTGFFPRTDGFINQRVASPSPYHYQGAQSKGEDSLVSDANTLLMLSQTAACR
eukprot:gb/GECG01015583.1/.p1 GENE.gb/GECG01015583.1/~~gb/GECG01015583.1/.p1  ORF type:complete len:470 (+),score=45.23 gb/GECG01015583.1/:1-1410(+)